MKIFLISTLIGFCLGILAGIAAIKGRGAVSLGSVNYEGWIGILITGCILAAIGFVIGLILYLLLRALKMASKTN